MPLTRKELAAKEAKRNLSAEWLQAITEIKEDHTGRITRIDPYCINIARAKVT